MTLPLLPTTVIGSYSMPAWLERAKNDFLQRKVSRHDLDEMYDAGRKAAITENGSSWAGPIIDSRQNRATISRRIPTSRISF